MKAFSVATLLTVLFFFGWVSYHYYPVGFSPLPAPYFTQWVLRPTFWLLAAVVFAGSFMGTKYLAK